MEYRSVTEKKIIDTIRLFENNDHIGYYISIHKNPKDEKVDISLSVTIPVDIDTKNYIGAISEFHDKMQSENYNEIILTTGGDHAMLFGHQ